MERLVVTASEAADMLCLRDGKCLELLEAGEIPGYRDGIRWKIPIVLLEKYVIERAEREAEERKRINEKMHEEG